MIIDCGPSLNLLNQNALSYVDEVIIPVTCDYLALVGVKQVLRTIKDVERHLGHAVRISAVLPTFYDGRTRLAREVLETLARSLQDTSASSRSASTRGSPRRRATRRPSSSTRRSRTARLTTTALSTGCWRTAAQHRSRRSTSEPQVAA